MTHTTQYNGKNAHPWRYGFVDAVQGRECKSPWAGEGYSAFTRNKQYLAGYMEGQKAAAKSIDKRGEDQRVKRYE